MRLDQHICQYRAAASVLDHNGITLMHQLTGLQGDLPLRFIVISDPGSDIIRALQDRIPVLTAYDPPAFQFIQILAHRDL